jgi:molybdopterin molybdotransferase
MWFGVKDDGERRVLVFGLPGNPVSSFVCFELFARPAIAALSGRGFISAPTVEAELKHEFTHAGGRAAYLPARVLPSNDAPQNSDLSNGALRWPGNPLANHVEILPWQGSADLATLARANGLVRLPNEPIRLAAGTPVDVLLV